jgi:hypothetical protein
VASTQINTQRRRSERVSQSLPLIVRGVDLLGQPFEERTSTLTFNLHGCRYVSKHHLPKNTWVTLELPQTRDRRNVRARVAWIQRPHSVREFFQIAVELESPANIWGIDGAPDTWTPMATHSSAGTGARAASVASAPPEDTAGTASPKADEVPAALASFMGKLMTDMANPSAETMTDEGPRAFEFTPASDSPLLRELRAGLERHAKQTVDAATADAHRQIRNTLDESLANQTAGVEEKLNRFRGDFEQFERHVREEFSAHLAAQKDGFQVAMKSEFEQNLGQVREASRNAAADMERSAEALRAETESAREAAKRLAQARLEMEAAEATRPSQAAEKTNEAAASVAGEAAMADWRRRVESEAKVAWEQWDELLQSSLDSGAQRLAERLTAHSEEILSSAEKKVKERLADIREPLADASQTAQEGAAAIKTQLEQEVSRAWASLAEIEHAAGRLKEYSAQLEAASQDTLNDLHRRLAVVLETQTAELNHRAEALAAGLAQRTRPALDSLSREFTERAAAELESKLRPHVDRVPELLRELSARGMQAEDSLRLHRERLRQVSEQHARETASQLSATLSDLRNAFEGARKEALAKWNEELDASGVRAAHAAAENIGRASEWFQQEARARLQVLVEQALAGAANGYEQKTAEAERKFEAQLASQTTAQIAGIERRVDHAAAAVAGRTRSQIEEASASAAASFGQVLRELSEEETRQFTDTSRAVASQRSQEFEIAAQELLRNLETTAGSSVEKFQSQMAVHLETRVSDARETLGAEFAAALEGHRTERDRHQREWLAGLEQMNEESARGYRERLEGSGDQWVVSSARRLNEHGQDTIESLLRSAEQAIRDSFAKIFSGLSESLRDQATGANSVPGFAPSSAGREFTETAPRIDTASNTANA